eukprot:Ihof_evm3s715 gene=Ihof_evmTU3s715
MSTKRSLDSEKEFPSSKMKKRVSWGDVRLSETYSMEEYDRHPPNSSEAGCSVSEEDISRFMIWLEENHVQFHKLSLCRSGDGYGTFAAEDIQSGDSLAFIPASIVITPAAVQASEIAKDIKDACAAEDKEAPTNRMLLYCFLISQRYTPGSKWYPYLKCIPASFNTPLWWGPTVDSTIILSGTNLGHHVVTESARLQAMCEACLGPLTRIMPHKYPTDTYCWENFLWAVSTCKSRAYSETMTPDGTNEVMLSLGPTGITYAV